tara:strand:+ start:2142 stop:2588 length:447 start_codon:yes stop_codon:yes gene_type:complete
VEVEVIDLFVNAAKLLALPKSVAEIYGLLFISPEPCSLDDLVTKLRMSKGSGSQGIRLLRTMGAIQSVYVPGSRCDHFAAVTELRKLVSGYFRGQVQEHLDNGDVRLQRITEAANEDSSEFYEQRIEKLEQWYGRAQTLLPMAQKILG